MTTLYPTVSGIETSPEAITSRHDALTSAVAGIRVRRGSRIPVERILLGAASVLFPLGLVFILLGWEGAAHNGHTYAQIDYLISGGIFGLGLSVAGGFMYFGYWLSRQLGEERRQSALTLQALGRIEELLDASMNARVGGDSVGVVDGVGGDGVGVDGVGGVGGGGVGGGGTGAARRPAPKASRSKAANGAVLYATPKGTLLHRAECPVVARRTDLRAVPAGSDEFGYCTMCDAAGVALDG